MGQCDIANRFARRYSGHRVHGARGEDAVPRGGGEGGAGNTKEAGGGGVWDTRRGGARKPLAQILIDYALPDLIASA